MVRDIRWRLRGVSRVGLKVARIRALVVGMWEVSWVFGLSQWVSVEPLWVPVEILRGFQPSLLPRYPGPPTHTPPTSRCTTNSKQGSTTCILTHQWVSYSVQTGSHCLLLSLKAPRVSTSPFRLFIVQQFAILKLGRVDIIFNNTPTGFESDHNYNILGFHIPVSVVVETPEVVPKPCNLFFIGQLWVAAPPWGTPFHVYPSRGSRYHLLFTRPAFVTSRISATEPLLK